MAVNFPEIPKENIEPDVARQLTTPRMEYPLDGFRPHVKEEDLEDFDKRDQRMLLTLSKVEQKVDYCVHWLMVLNRHVRRVEAENIRQREAQSQINWRWTIIRWLGIVFTAGIVAGLAKALAAHLWR